MYTPDIGLAGGAYPDGDGTVEKIVRVLFTLAGRAGIIHFLFRLYIFGPALSGHVDMLNSTATAGLCIIGHIHHAAGQSVIEVLHHFFYAYKACHGMKLLFEQ
jgi:hypothetical protein